MRRTRPQNSTAKPSAGTTVWGLSASWRESAGVMNGFLLNPLLNNLIGKLARSFDHFKVSAGQLEMTKLWVVVRVRKAKGIT